MKIQVKQTKLLDFTKHKIKDIYHEYPHKYKSIIKCTICETRNKERNKNIKHNVLPLTYTTHKNKYIKSKMNTS